MRAPVCSLVAVLLLVSAASADRPPSKPLAPPPTTKSPSDLSQPLELRSSGDTLWLHVGQPPSGQPWNGGENTGGPRATEGEVFTFEGGDPCAATGDFPLSGRCFTHTDVRTHPSLEGDRFYWHLDSYQAWDGYSWWCGTSTGGICRVWDNAPGYGDQWRQYLALDPGILGISAGDTVALDCWLRYDLECDYDYAYIQYSNNDGASWTTIATFNGSAGNLHPPEVCGGDYFDSHDFGQGYPPGGNVSWMSFPKATSPEDGYLIVDNPDSFLVGFYFESDAAWSDQDGRGDTDGALFVDDVLVTTLHGETLEFEDMDSNFEAEKWELLRPPGIADFWTLHFDVDPPNEPEEGADICESNATWQFAAAPYINNRWRIPRDANGFYYRLMTPAIYTGWGEPEIPKEDAGVVCQYDWSPCAKESFCDNIEDAVRVYRADKEAWCDWDIWDWWWWFSCSWVVDITADYQWMLTADVDSVQFGWDIMDLGQTDDWCWTTTQPPPHKKTQLLVDNVSIGLYDVSHTFFHARVIDMFQDTFDLITDAHNALLANGDMPKPSGTLARSESLQVDIHDTDWLVGPNSYTRLYFSVDRGSNWDYNDLVLAIPDENNPNLGGTYIGSISAMEALGQTKWIPGTEVWYYVEVKDDDGNLAYWPRTADPAEPPAPRPYFNNYYEFCILPGVDQLEEPNRLLYVDDFQRDDYDYHPCMEESTLWRNEDFYESALLDLGFRYDKYDVQGASTGLSNEPWDLIYAPDPANPDSLERRYDAVIWNTSRFDQYTVLDTMQCRLVDFVREGGHLFICGNLIGVDMTDYGSYSNAAAETCEFYGGLLGAEMQPPGDSPLGINNPHLYAKGTGVAPSQLDEDDKFHFHIGCPIYVPHDLMRINDSPPPWSNPQPYLIYEDGYSPGDTLVAIYNEYDGGGKIVHMCFDLAALVDSSSVSCAKSEYRGRSDLLKDILVELFGLIPHLTAIPDDFVPLQTYAYSLGRNYPNPFNPDAYIEFSIRHPGRVSLVIYDVTGRAVKTLVNEVKQPGQYRIRWDGTNERGELVSSGIYFCKMEAGDFRATRKMILLK